MRPATRVSLSILALAIAGCSGVVHRPPADAARIEQGLRPRVVVEGDAPVAWEVHERMRRYRVPTLVVAVIRHGQVAWSARYTSDGGSAYPASDVLFQAASLSKGLTGSLAATLAAKGKLDLDEPVDRCLAPLVLPPGKQSAAHPVTLRELLHHTAGATVNGFPGYPVGSAVPSPEQVILGKPPAITPAVTIATEPGAVYAYSGGGYTLAQVAIEHCAGEPFASLMQHNVLGPAGMRVSTFQQPLPGSVTHATGHDDSGAAVPGGANTYPELAAAGLWTTPTDLAAWLIGVRDAQMGLPSFMPPEAAHEMLRPGLSKYGLGVFITGDGAHRRFMHSGGNFGFKTSYVMFVESGDGVVVMTDGDNGAFVGGELIKAVAATYGWPDIEPRRATRQSLNDPAMRLRAGRYAFDQADDRGRRTFDLREDATGWYVDHPDLGRVALVPTGALSFVCPETGDTIVADTNDKDVIRIGDRPARRLRDDEVQE